MSRYDSKVSVLLVIIFALLLVILGMEVVTSTRSVIVDQTTHILNATHK